MYPFIYGRNINIISLVFEGRLMVLFDVHFGIALQVQVHEFTTNCKWAVITRIVQTFAFLKMFCSQLLNFFHLV